MDPCDASVHSSARVRASSSRPPRPPFDSTQVAIPSSSHAGGSTAVPSPTSPTRGTVAVPGGTRVSVSCTRCVISWRSTSSVRSPPWKPTVPASGNSGRNVTCALGRGSAKALKTSSPPCSRMRMGNGARPNSAATLTSSVSAADATCWA